MTTTLLRRLGRRPAATLVAGGSLTATLGPSAPVSASAATLAGWPGGRGPGATRDGSTQAGTVDSDPATKAESRGVALIDTVLGDGEAAGTGIVLTADGEVLTSYHVVEGSTSVRVTLPGSAESTGKTYTATVVGADRAADVALLQLAGARGLTAATIDDDTLAVGDDVTAVGNAGGTGTLTAADGDVTDLAASITTQSDGTVEGERQDIDGYAVPIRTALAVVTQIRSGDGSSAVRIGAAASLGVQVATSAVADSGYAYGDGSAAATVAGVVAGDAADDAGLAAGDTITRVGSTTVTDAAGLTKALSTREPGDRVSVTWTTSDGEQQSATVTLDSSPVS